jgi:hypothetical protein
MDCAQSAQASTETPAGLHKFLIRARYFPIDTAKISWGAVSGVAKGHILAEIPNTVRIGRCHGPLNASRSEVARPLIFAYFSTIFTPLTDGTMTHRALRM